MHFEQLDYSVGGEHVVLIDAFGERKNQFLKAAQLIPDQPLVALPTLEVLYRQLAHRGFSAEKLPSCVSVSAAFEPSSNASCCSTSVIKGAA